MSRSGLDARERLERAALELFEERGYERTTTAQIAAAAGVTERTFFRHFDDKCEVLFKIDCLLDEALQRALGYVSPELSPMASMLQAFRWTIAAIEGNRQLAEARGRIVAATPALRERELAKSAAMSGHVAEALRARGLSERRAVLLAQAGTSAASYAVQTWMTNPSANLDTELLEAFADLDTLLSAEMENGPASALTQRR